MLYHPAELDPRRRTANLLEGVTQNLLDRLFYSNRLVDREGEIEGGRKRINAESYVSSTWLSREMIVTQTIRNLTHVNKTLTDFEDRDPERRRQDRLSQVRTGTDEATKQAILESPNRELLVTLLPEKSTPADKWMKSLDTAFDFDTVTIDSLLVALQELARNELTVQHGTERITYDFSEFDSVESGLSLRLYEQCRQSALGMLARKMIDDINPEDYQGFGSHQLGQIRSLEEKRRNITEELSRDPRFPNVFMDDMRRLLACLFSKQKSASYKQAVIFGKPSLNDLHMDLYYWQILDTERRLNPSQMSDLDDKWAFIFCCHALKNVTEQFFTTRSSYTGVYPSDEYSMENAGKEALLFISSLAKYSPESRSNEEWLTTQEWGQLQQLREDIETNLKELAEIRKDSKRKK